MTDRMDINRLLVEMRSLKSQTQAFQPVGKAGGDIPNGISPTGQVGPANGPRFEDLFSQAINKVNGIQKASGAAAQAYVKGDPNVDITDVMIASQKSSVAFQATMQVRNKVVEAYKDVMNMPI